MSGTGAMELAKGPRLRGWWQRPSVRTRVGNRSRCTSGPTRQSTGTGSPSPSWSASSPSATPDVTFTRGARSRCRQFRCCRPGYCARSFTKELLQDVSFAHVSRMLTVGRARSRRGAGAEREGRRRRARAHRLEHGAGLRVVAAHKDADGVRVCDGVPAPRQAGGVGDLRGGPPLAHQPAHASPAAGAEERAGTRQERAARPSGREGEVTESGRAVWEGVGRLGGSAHVTSSRHALPFRHACTCRR
mmetsp:Transcript_46925/g.153658  ORF Transcript_46925/g.153658 Transcript_46925/m.153658 type:complete len:246 (+) Transcript_46925:175-912(+)